MLLKGLCGLSDLRFLLLQLNPKIGAREEGTGKQEFKPLEYCEVFSFLYGIPKLIVYNLPISGRVDVRKETEGMLSGNMAAVINTPRKFTMRTVLEEVSVLVLPSSFRGASRRADRRTPTCEYLQ